ncbi:MAG: hypothetical protein HZB38_05565 [Planctomycetes bacterium]|nr:hypothetical protein [Planctomycetota bacterium]
MTGADPRTGTLWVGAASNASFFVAKWNGAGFEPASTFAWVESTDKPFMAAGPRPGQPNTTRLYVSFWATSGRYLTWSDDFGATWPGNLPLPSPPAGLSISTLPRVGPNGELYIFTDDGRFGIYLIRSLSENAGTPNLEQPIRIATRLDTWDPGRPEFNVRIPGYFNAAPYTHGAVDPVSDGTLYCVYHDTTRALCSCCPEVCTAWDIDIYFVMSTDFGATWTPVPQRILGADHVPYDQFFPWIEAVRSPVERSATRLDLVFFDTRGAVHTDADYPALLRTQYAWSNDRGATWQETTVAPRFAGAPAVWRATDTWYGEYIGMASAPTLAVPVYPTGGPGPAFNPPDWPPEEHIWANPIIWP